MGYPYKRTLHKHSFIVGIEFCIISAATLWNHCLFHKYSVLYISVVPLNCVGQLSNNIVDYWSVIKTHTSSLTPHHSVILFVVEHSCSMWYISCLFVATLSPSVQASLACFHEICPFARVNHFRVHEYHLMRNAVFSIPVHWHICHTDWITPQLNDKTYTLRRSKMEIYAIEFYQGLLWELVCLDTSALVSVGRLYD